MELFVSRISRRGRRDQRILPAIREKRCALLGRLNLEDHGTHRRIFTIKPCRPQWAKSNISQCESIHGQGREESRNFFNLHHASPGQRNNKHAVNRDADAQRWRSRIPSSSSGMQETRAWRESGAVVGITDGVEWASHCYSVVPTGWPHGPQGLTRDTQRSGTREAR